MTEQESKNLIKETFESDFNKERFKRFIANLLTDYTELSSSPFIKDAYKDRIKSCELIARFVDSDQMSIDVLVTYLKEESYFEARTLQRNFALDYIKARNKDGVLVAFINGNEKDWRFSFVKLERNIVKETDGKVVEIENFTAAKRSSFLVGPNENSYTAKRQFLSIIQREDTPKFGDIEEAFGVEKVTKEFFEKYKELFNNVNDSLKREIKNKQSLREEFEKKEISTVDFSKKLLGQMVFLYFLQKKGWFGVATDKEWGSGPKDFLRKLFDAREKYGANFFNDVLEPLFYEALAQNRGDDAKYPRLNNCRMPFLNGGLFEPMRGYSWKTTDIFLPDDLFSNSNKTKEGDKGDGILDIFDRYNFTVNESDPLEIEVAVDPEMLGKVFESLLDVNDRKSKGAFYTPREIVHYMCQECLINYLETETKGQIPREDIENLVLNGETIIQNDLEALERIKKKGKYFEDKSYKILLPESIRTNATKLDNLLESVKICDPSVGSGAFPLGMINEIVGSRHVLHKVCLNDEKSIYDLKRHAIANSIHGVDIELSAVDIARLRLWLSLIVDQKKPSPLPNLEHRIMQGNSLLEEFEGIKLFDENLLVTASSRQKELSILKEKLSSLQKEFIDIYQDSFKKESCDKIISEVKDIQRRIKLLNNQESSKSKEIQMFAEKDEIIEKTRSLENKQQEFFGTFDDKLKKELRVQIDDLVWDIIESTLRNSGKAKELTRVLSLKELNNKPFFLWRLNFSEVFKEKDGFDIVIGNPPYVGEKGHKEIFRELKRGNMGKYYQGKMDLFYFFFHLALDLAHDKANIAFITTNYYPTALGAKKLRTDLKDRSSIRNLLNFNELRIFESARGQHNMVTIFSKEKEDSKIAQNFITRRKGNANEQILKLIISGKDLETDYYSTKQVDLYDGPENYIRLEGSNGKGEGIDSILEKIKVQGEVLGSICNVNQGIVTGADKVSEKHRRKYDWNEEKGTGIFVLNDAEVQQFENKQYFKKWYKNSDIHKYYSNKDSKQNILYINSEFKEEEDIINHLTRFKENLSERREVHKGSRKWYDLWRGRVQEIFESPKIVAPQRSNENTFGYNESPWYASADVYFITSKEVMNVELKYLLALLNSKVYYQWLYHRGKRKGEALELYQVPLSEIPIKIISKGDQRPFIALVNKILSITSQPDYDPHNPPEEQKALEKEIDQIVYQLYGLTKEEIELVEKSTKS